MSGLDEINIFIESFSSQEQSTGTNPMIIQAGNDFELALFGEAAVYFGEFTGEKIDKEDIGNYEKHKANFKDLKEKILKGSEMLISMKLGESNFWTDLAQGKFIGADHH